MYRIREVDGQDEEIADMLADIHKLTFFDSACLPEFDQGHWWLAFQGATPVAFAGVVPSTQGRISFPCRGGPTALRQCPAIAPNARDGVAGTK
jgi:hypothetical protein